MDNDYLWFLSKIAIDFYYRWSTSCPELPARSHPSEAGGITFNSGSHDYDFKINGEDTTPIFQVSTVTSGGRESQNKRPSCNWKVMKRYLTHRLSRSGG